MNSAAIERTLSETLVAYGLSVVAGFLILILGWYLAGLAARFTRRQLTKRNRLDRTYVPVVENFVRYGILLIAVIAVLDQFGIEIASIIAVLSTIGIAVALAVQGTLSNLAAGIMILITRPIRTGDLIEADGNTGVVDEVGLFLTAIHTKDGTAATIPNVLLWTRTVKNFSRDLPRRIDFELALAAPENLDEALPFLRELIGAEDKLLADPLPDLEGNVDDDGNATVQIGAWTKAPDASLLAWRLKGVWQSRLETAGLAPPAAGADAPEAAADKAPTVRTVAASSLPTPPPPRRKRPGPGAPK